jgi:tight adherence protein C
VEDRAGEGLTVISPLQLVALALVFVTSVLLVLAFGGLAARGRARRRLKDTTGHRRSIVADVAAGNVGEGDPGALGSMLDSLSRLSVPEGGWQDSRLWLKFMRAGLRSPTAPRTYYGLKSALTLVLPILVGTVLLAWAPNIPSTHVASWVVGIAAAGYYLPDFVLRTLTQRRVDSMRDTLPDLIDLLVICSESGMGLDAAINRVSQEIARSDRALAEEFYLAALEIRAGSGRSTALRNLALRVNLEDLNSLVSMLVQADRFGTSLADSLRVHSEVMRVRRIQRAEEIAAKVPVKMLLPLMLFIFPPMMAVLIGPAILQMGAAFGR